MIIKNETKTNQAHSRISINSKERQPQRRIKCRQEQPPKIVSFWAEDRGGGECVCWEEAAEIADDCFEEVGVGGWLETGVGELKSRRCKKWEEGRRKMKREGGRRTGKGRSEKEGEAKIESGKDIRTV
jgi:hypothetical protein